MSNINGVGYSSNVPQNDGTVFDEKEKIELEDISILYTTDKKEEDRGDFDDTYTESSVSKEQQGAAFLQGLIDNKDSLCEDLGISSEQYDSLACVALALASQETGMGHEEGYNEENNGGMKILRSIGKFFDYHARKNGSASSGLTQMKIYDFLNGNVLSQEQKDILLNYGIEANGISDNNLYANQDKSAIATMVVLSDIADNYGAYLNMLQTEHENVSENLGTSMTEEEKYSVGEKILDNICLVYEESSTAQKIRLRKEIEDVFIAVPGNKDPDYNEELQIEQLNQLLSNNGADFELKQSDLDYIRFVLTSESQEMNIIQYCAYGWNKGITASGMKLDRTLSDKLRTILSTPEDFGYNQHTDSVAKLAQKYAEQSVSNGLVALSQPLLDDLMA